MLSNHKNENQVLVKVTSIICSLGQSSNTAVVESLQDTAPFVNVIGDTAKVATIINAVFWGHHAELNM